MKNKRPRLRRYACDACGNVVTVRGDGTYPGDRCPWCLKPYDYEIPN